MKKTIDRRSFLKLAAMGSFGISLKGYGKLSSSLTEVKETKVGIIGLDTSHSVNFTKILNNPQVSPELAGYPVVAAYPKGSLEIEDSYSRIPGYTTEMKKMGIDIVDSEEELLDKVDVVLLETNDGNRHLEQALKVFKAGKRVFIDKPIAASLSDAIAIFDAADKYNVPMFSSSSLRYMKNAQAIRHGKVGKVLGAEAYSPASNQKNHPDLFWYGIHGVETLFTVMGTGCKKVVRIHTKDTDVVVGTWDDGRIGTFRGRRSGKHDYGGTAFGTKGEAQIGPYGGYRPLLVKIVEFFRTGKAPVNPDETIEIFAFMAAANESERRGGEAVDLESIIAKARQEKNS